MRKDFNIFVEGVADECFLKQFLCHVFGEEVPNERIVVLKGWDNLKTEASALRMRSMTANGGVLLPNNQDTGALEDLLENIINPNNRPIFDCWENYEKELVTLDIPGRTPPPLTTPAKKTKIYGYLEALLGESNTQKELIKEVNRNYENTLHWSLDAEYLEPLKEFLKRIMV